MSKPSSSSRSPDLPPDLEVVEVLADSDRGQVLKVRRDGEDLVVRVGSGTEGDFALEISLAGRLNDPALVPPLEWGRTPGGRPFLLRRFVEGRPFDEAAAAQPDKVEGWVRALLESLGTLHEAGLVHRDIKAGNVLIGEQGPILVDLDLMAGADDAAGAGSAFHIAPEVLLGHPVSPAADLFSVGVMVAIALCGECAEEFHHRFPRTTFWEASGLDASQLSGEMGSLVRQMVRRNPADRPASAHEAALRLQGDVAVLPPLTMPFLAGRDAALRRMVSEVDAPAGERLVALLTVGDEEEVEPVLEAFQLAVTLGGRRVVREVLEDPIEACLERIGRRDADVVLVDGVEAAAALHEDAVTDLVASFLSTSRGRSGALALVADPVLSQEIIGRLRQRNLDEGVSGIRLLSWPRVPVGALSRHLDRLTGGASPQAAQKLGRGLHELTVGRLADCNRVLEQAVDGGVLRPDGSQYTVLRSEWPSELAPGADRELDASWPEACRAVLAALAVSAAPLRPSRVRSVAELEARPFAEAVATLREQGVLRERRDESGALAVTDRRWLAAAARSLDEEERRAFERRCLEVLEADGGPEVAIALHRVALAESGADLVPLLDVVRALLDGGRYGAARRLVQELAGRAEALDDAAREQLCSLEARLELAQGDAKRALSVVHEAYGTGLEAASVDLLLVAAIAAEQAGQRTEARRLNELALAAGPDREQELLAITSLAQNDFLDGDIPAVLERTEGVVRDDDPHDPASRILNWRGVALTGLGRLDEAEEQFDRALERAEAAGSPLLVARVELSRARLDRRHGKPTRAVEALRRAVGAFSEAGHVQGRAIALNNLGVLHRDRGELAQARALLTDALDIRRRVGDVHGAASSLGSLATAQLESGQVGLALETFERAAELFAEGDYEAELAFVDVQQAVALSLVGRHGQAASVLSTPRVDRARLSHAALVERAEALVHLASDQRKRAEDGLKAAVAAAQTAGDPAELFRAASSLLAIHPAEAETVALVEQAAEQLDSPVRLAEARWRSRAVDAPVDRDELEGWLDVFQEAGRTDLVRAVALVLADAFDAEGDPTGRRAATARAAEAADALTDGLPPADFERVLERLSRLAGPRPRRMHSGSALGVDWLLSCNRRMATEEDLDGLLLSIVDMALDLTGARRGFLVLMDGDQVDVQVARNMDQEDMLPEEAQFSRTVVREALSTGQPVMTTNAASDERFAGAMSINLLNLRSVLCVPVPSPEGVLGALYLDDDTPRAALDETDVERVRALADQASLAITEQRRRAEIQALNERLSQRVEYQEQELEKTRTALRKRGEVAPVAGLVGDSEAMRRVYGLLDRVAPTDLAVLVTGPSGTGKDVVARAIHERSHRASGPLVVENVAAVPASLLESELFGHVRGAFTGADRDRKGLFAEADGGTFVLDEIGELPMELQPKLLRVLEAGEVRPVGSRSPVKIDVRIVAATNRDLLERVREGEFREDLYYRLNAVEISLPPLAERLDDVPLLVQHFLDRLNAKHETDKPVTDEVVQSLMRRNWPGQVRELANEVSRLYFLSDEVIDNTDLVRTAAASDAVSSTEAMPESLKLEDVERAAIQRALKSAGGRKEQAAKLLGISRAGLYAKIRRLEVDLDGGDED